jgi:hypothetical protein
MMIVYFIRLFYINLNEFLIHFISKINFIMLIIAAFQ